MFFRDERDRDFLKACEDVRMKNKHLSASQIAKIAVYSPTQSFYLISRYYTEIINKIRKGKVTVSYKSTELLYQEIERRMKDIPGHECMSAYEIARIIDSQPAPRFYISEARAVALYYESLNKIRKENELRCRTAFFTRNFISN